MLIGGATLTERGIKLVDVDGTPVEFDAQDALDLLTWLDAHRTTLVDIMRREQRRATVARARKEEEECL